MADPSNSARSVAMMAISANAQREYSSSLYHRRYCGRFASQLRMSSRVISGSDLEVTAPSLTERIWTTEGQHET